ncbi:hypothetical protein [Polaribacter ponticola]|uniref:Carboxypeptidase regulatory-like domain-containing protein n=1 Tax=Polaribacter ponticola TaxID=2978475 RepID=A0ABT5S8T1_9FLAO|nr:hypothetical protein [Polaribacter sp. MSW5]MDD7913727.1 hypothetical protein [Polaribacter sp. MSW5]
MKTYKLLIPIVILCSLFNSSCTTENTESIENKTFNFKGKILDVHNMPIENASIVIGETEVFSDVNGNFYLNELEISTDITKVKVKKEGYINGLRLLSELEEENNIELSLLNKLTTSIINPFGDTIIHLLGHFSLLIYDGHFIKEDGSIVSELIFPITHHIFPSNPILNTVIPGNYENNEEIFGLAYVSLEREEQIFDLAEGNSITLQFTIEDSMVSNAPETINIWNFNEETGDWLVLGEATKEYILSGDKWIYRAQVSSFLNPWFKIKI